MNKVQRRVEASLKGIYKFYDQGTESLQDGPGRMTYGGMNAVKKRGESPELLRKARVFADPEVGYTRRELDRLIRDARQAEYALSYSHIIRLLSVPKGRKRNDLEQQAIAGRWKRDRLDAQIRQKFGQRRVSAGRRARKPDDAGEALVLITKLCQKWTGLMRQVMPAGKPAFRLSPAVIKQLKAVSGQILAIQISIADDRSA
jgi:hypothetical protein